MWLMTPCFRESWDAVAFCDAILIGAVSEVVKGGFVSGYLTNCAILGLTKAFRAVFSSITIRYREVDSPLRYFGRYSVTILGGGWNPPSLSR